MTIENRDLEPGTKLIAKYKKEEYRAEVVAGEEGNDQIPAVRRQGVQEPFSRRDSHHQQGLQRLGVLEHRDWQRPNRTRGAGDLGRRRLRRYGDPGAGACRWVPPGGQPEGRRRGTGETLLRRLPEELYHTDRSTARDLPGGPLPRRGFLSLATSPGAYRHRRQVPLRGLPSSLSDGVTIAPDKQR